jgi:hypothetical protein
MVLNVWAAVVQGIQIEERLRRRKRIAKRAGERDYRHGKRAIKYVIALPSHAWEYCSRHSGFTGFTVVVFPIIHRRTGGVIVAI